MSDNEDIDVEDIDSSSFESGNDSKQYLKIVFSIAKDNFIDYGDEEIKFDEETEEKADSYLEQEFVEFFHTRVTDFSVFCVTKTSDESSTVKIGWLWKKEKVVFKTDRKEDTERYCKSKKYPGVKDLKKIIEVPSYTDLIDSGKQGDMDFIDHIRNFVTFWFLQDHTILFGNTDYIWMNEVDVD